MTYKPQKGLMGTRSGRMFNLVNPRKGDVCIGDISFAIARINRYTGHADPEISVAVHCLLCAQQASPPAKLWALTHNAHKAYVGDVSRPLRELLPDYRRIERRVQDAVVRAILGDWPPREVQDEVCEIDERMSHTEARTLLGNPPWATTPYLHDVVDEYVCCTPPVASKLWLARYNKLSEFGSNKASLRDKKRGQP